MDEIIFEKIDAFFTGFKHQAYKKGEIVIRADDDPAGIFYLKEGCVKEYAISRKGEELVINVFKPISFFPMSWAINQTPNVYFFEAMTNLEVWRAPKDEVIIFLKNNPDVLYNLMSRVYKGIDGLLNRMVYLMSGSAHARLITELIIHSKRFGKGQNTIKIDITEKDLAAQSGLTRETVSRGIKILKNKGLVILNKNKLVIQDVSKLEEELAGGA